MEKLNQIYWRQNKIKRITAKQISALRAFCTNIIKRIENK